VVNCILHGYHFLYDEICKYCMVETAISFTTGLEVIIIALAIIYAIYIRTKLLRASYYLRQET
jgi:hypothetical protein